LTGNFESQSINPERFVVRGNALRRRPAVICGGRIKWKRIGFGEARVWFAPGGESGSVIKGVREVD
jgi:hypothetical protein